MPATRLRLRRQAKGLSLFAASRALGFSMPAVLSRYELRQTTPPPDAAKRLERFYGEPIASLLSDFDERDLAPHKRAAR